SKKKKSTFFSILACNTSNTKWLTYSRSQHLTRLANDFPVFLLNRSKLPTCFSLFFSILACNTSNTKWLIYSLSQHLTRLANDFLDFFAQPVEVTNMLILYFFLLACNTSNTKWLIYSRSQHLTRLANDFPVFLLKRSKLPICSYYFFLFWPVTLQTLNGSSTVVVST